MQLECPENNVICTTDVRAHFDGGCVHHWRHAAFELAEQIDRRIQSRKPGPEPIARFKSSCDQIVVEHREGANDERIRVTDIGYGNMITDSIGLTPGAARKLSTVLDNLADALDPERFSTVSRY